VTCRLALVTEIISPYRIPLFNALARHSGIDLHVIFLAETDPALRQWEVYKEEIRFKYRVLPSWRRRIAGYNILLNRGVAGALAEAAPDMILCGGYNYPASWQALHWSRNRNMPFFLWSESNIHDQRRGFALVEMMKCEFLRECSGFVVPGKSGREYLGTFGIKADRIFTARNAVDNAYFAAAFIEARANAAKRRAELALPDRYFLFVGRLVEEKGIFDLLAAYAKLDGQLREQIALVFAGDGVCRPDLERRASRISPGIVRFTGFAQRERLAMYYALAEMLILPTFTDPWGLVVNEAMACHLPVIVSSAAGCAADLVMDNWNGFVCTPGNADLLSDKMKVLATDRNRAATMGANSFEHVSNYSPEEWARGIIHAIGAWRSLV
jgi:glycosyltransferase involved in cell wall biosynthesis